MHDSNVSPETLLAVPDDFEAAMIVSALAAHGIDASTSGSFTAGMRAEAPGDVQVLVRSCDLAQAREALQEIRASASADEPSDVDSRVDSHVESRSNIRGKIILFSLFLCLLFMLAQLFF